MTIQRQYSLPNCTLLLEGLSDATTGNAQEVRPVMSILVNAECHLAGKVPSLSGGRDFFESLVRAVSRYAQEFLSGVPHPPEDGQTQSLVQLQPVERNLHRLVVQNQADVVSNGATTNGKPNHPIQIDLTTVQLCDLVEAVDQFFADSQTLPELSLQLAPVERRYARTDEPVAKRAVPPAVGVSSLALAAIAFFLVPVPQRPVETQPQSENSTSTTATETSPTTPGASPSPTPVDPTASPSPTNLPPNANALISPEPSPTESPTGEAQVSPSPTESPTGEAQVSPSPTESPTGETQVSPSPTPTELTQTPTAESSPSETQTSPELQITDRRQLRQLSSQLYDKIEQNRGEEPLRFASRLEYRVGVRADGTVVSYEGQNQAAIDNASQTPLAKIKSENTATSSPEPIAYYRVVFTRRGVLQVSPW